MDQQPYQQPYQQPHQQTPPSGPVPGGYGYAQMPPQGQFEQGQMYRGQPGQPAYPQQYAPMTIDPHKGQAVSGFILGLVGLIAVFFVWISGLVYIDMIVAILGIILSTMGMKSSTSRGLAIAGLVLSIIGLVIAGIILLVALSFLSALSHL